MWSDGDDREAEGEAALRPHQPIQSGVAKVRLYSENFSTHSFTQLFESFPILAARFGQSLVRLQHPSP